MLLLLVSYQGKAQLSRDTVIIKEVIISGHKSDAVLPGFTRTEIDTAVLENFSLRTVAEAISLSSNIYIKSYGNGGTATSSIRGTGASGTQVTWNGIRLDNPMLGQPDLAILTTGMTDKINIYAGGSSMLLNSGSSGGIISLESAPDWDSRTKISFSPGVGSFGKYGALVTAETGSGNFNSVTKAFIQSSENNFTYIDDVSRAGSFKAVRHHNEVRQKSFMQELYNKLPGGVLSAHLWYQHAQRNLPSSLLTEFAGERQKDVSFRSILHYENERNYSLTAAYIMSDLNYTNRLVDIDSRNHSDGVVFKAGVKKNISNIVGMGLIFNEEFTSVRSNNYDGKAFRNSADISLSLQSISSEVIRGSFLVRQILYNHRLLVPDFSTGIMVKPFASKEYFIKSNFSRNSRIPTMNDLYWYPGGNPDLKNEYAIMSELGIKIDESISSFRLRYDMTLFRSSIRDMIQWRPGEFNYWNAENISNVLTRGIESSVSLLFSQGKLSSVLKAGYSYTRSTDETEKKSNNQLVYIPENMANGSFRFNYGIFHSEWLTNLTGIRFTSVDNDDFLPSFIVNNLSAGIRYKRSWGLADLSFGIDNIFNVSYQNIAYYPLPGRSFELRLLAQITLRK